MTREEQIQKEAVSFCNKVCPQLLVGEYSFIQGAEWADKHPKSPWISVEDDLPYNHEELIITGNYYKKETINVITIDKHEIIDNYMVLCDGGKWEWKYGVKPYYWMPIPELPKEKEIKL